MNKRQRSKLEHKLPREEKERIKIEKELERAKWRKIADYVEKIEENAERRDPNPTDEDHEANDTGNKESVSYI